MIVSGNEGHFANSDWDLLIPDFGNKLSLELVVGDIAVSHAHGFLESGSWHT